MKAKFTFNETKKALDADEPEVKEEKVEKPVEEKPKAKTGMKPEVAEREIQVKRKEVEKIKAKIKILEEQKTALDAEVLQLHTEMTTLAKSLETEIVFASDRERRKWEALKIAGWTDEKIEGYLAASKSK